MRALLRIIPLLTVPLIAVGLMSGELVQAMWGIGVAVLKTLMWGMWVCGPLALAVSLALVSRESVPRVVAEVLLVLLAGLNLVAFAVAVVWPFVSLREVFFYLPFFEFMVLSVVVALTLAGLAAARFLAKKAAPATLGPS